MKRICVFCGARPGNEPTYPQAARQVGALIAGRGLTLVYGGGGRGMMGAVADGALDAGGSAIGVIPRNLFKREALHPGLTEVRAVDTMLERKTVMAGLSDGFISLPGGIGTLDELFEMWTWGQLGLHEKPNGILNVDGYFDALLAFLDRVAACEFLSAPQRGSLIVESSPEAIVDRIASEN